MAKFDFDCNRPERSQGEDLHSAQEVQKWDAEKNNPSSILADIGILFIDQAERAGVLADYGPPNAASLPEDLHGPGWVATFIGAPAFLVNLDFMEQQSLPVPESWADLLNPLYAGRVGLTRVGVAGNGTWAFAAMNLAAGGTVDDYGPGIDYARRLLPNLTQAATLDTFERGEVPISIRYDFNHLTWAPDPEERGVRYRIVFPTDGSIWGPSALMMNRYDTAHADFGRMFMEWVLTDEGQNVFAKFARPIRTVVPGDSYTVPDDIRARWLPDAMYEQVRTVDFTRIHADELLEIWDTQVVDGS